MKYDRAFADMGWFLLHAQQQCIVAFLRFKDFKQLQSFVNGLFSGDDIKKLQNIFFTNQLFEKVKLLQDSLISNLNNEEEKEDIKKMLGYLLSKLKIAVYVDYFEFVNLLIKQKEQTTPSKLKIIIDLPWKERQMPIGSSDALLELYRQTMPKGRYPAHTLLL